MGKQTIIFNRGLTENHCNTILEDIIGTIAKQNNIKEKTIWGGWMKTITINSNYMFIRLKNKKSLLHFVECIKLHLRFNRKLSEKIEIEHLRNSEINGFISLSSFSEDYSDVPFFLYKKDKTNATQVTRKITHADSNHNFQVLQTAAFILSTYNNKKQNEKI